MEGPRHTEAILMQDAVSGDGGQFSCGDVLGTVPRKLGYVSHWVPPVREALQGPPVTMCWLVAPEPSVKLALVDTHN